MEEKTLKVKVDRCPECGSENLIQDYESREYVCGDCGLVIKEMEYDRGPEWRAFDLEEKEKRSRGGKPLTYTLHDKGLTTSISPFDRDTYRKPLKPEQKETFYRLRKWQKRMRLFDSSERSLAFALAQANKISNNLLLPKYVAEYASQILTKLVKERLLRGRDIKSTAAASVYLACRDLEIPRTLDEVAEAANEEKRRVGSTYRFIVQEGFKELDYKPPVPSHSIYVSKTGVSGLTEGITHKILRAAKEVKLTSGRSPIGTITAAAYIASVLTGERITQRDLAEKMRCTEVTIRNRYRELIERLMFIVEL